MKSIKYIVLLFAFTTSFAQWTKGKGNAYLKTSIWALLADEHYTDTGDTASNPERLNLNLNIYGEYGITDKLDVIAYVPFFSRVVQAEQVSAARGAVSQEKEDFNAIGDIDLGVRYGLFKNDQLAISASLTLGLPTGDDSGGSDETFVTGDGEFNQLLKISAGTSYPLFSNPSYAKVYGGFNNRTEGFADEYRLGAETGVKFFDKLWVIGRLDTIQSLDNGDDDKLNSSGSIFASGLEFTSLGIETAYYITDKIGFSAGVTGALSGKFIYSAPSYTFGIFLDL